MDTTTATAIPAADIIRDIDTHAGHRLVSRTEGGALYDMGRIVAGGPGFIQTDRAGELISWTVAPTIAYLVR